MRNKNKDNLQLSEKCVYIHKSLSICNVCHISNNNKRKIIHISKKTTKCLQASVKVKSREMRQLVLLLNSSY